MNETIGTAVIVGIQKIEETIKTLAPKVWGAYLTQQYVTAIQMSLWAFLMAGFVVVGFFLWRRGKKLLDKRKDSYDDAYEVFYICGIGLMVISGFIFMALISSAIGHFYNPEYYAIKDIMMSFRGMV